MGRRFLWFVATLVLIYHASAGDLAWKDDSALQASKSNDGGQAHPYQNSGSGIYKIRNKRFSMDFNGMRVSYPQYIRLVRLQEKVIKLEKMIQALHANYPKDYLEGLMYYQKLMSMYRSLAPLLPPDSQSQMYGRTDDTEISQLYLGGQEMPAGSVRERRSPVSMDFMGMRVSYPQYVRLVGLQQEVVKLDQLMLNMLRTRNVDQLEALPKWRTLLSLHKSLKKLLPQDYKESGETFEEAAANIQVGKSEGTAAVKKRATNLKESHPGAGKNFNDYLVYEGSWQQLLPQVDELASVPLYSYSDPVIKATDDEIFSLVKALRTLRSSAQFEDQQK